MLTKLLIATVLLIGTMVVMYRIQRRIKGRRWRHAVWPQRKRKESASSSASELEQFVAAYRREKMLAGNGNATSNAAGAAPSAPATAAAVQHPVKVREVFLPVPPRSYFWCCARGCRTITYSPMRASPT